MKLGIIAANGKAGQAIVNEALSRNLDVTAIVRGENKTAATKMLKKDLFDLTYEDVKEFDVLIDAFGAFTPETLPQHTTSIVHLTDILNGKTNRLLVVGGAGSLYTDATHTTQLMEGKDFPAPFYPLASNMSEALAVLRTKETVNWTYLSPAADFQADGERTGEYLLRGEEFSVNDQGESVISYKDYAIAMIDEAVSGHHVRERISVLKK
ncbi:NADH-flavin reductase [Enterococcus sp. JM4C]|uniref:SDR family oxidoreductase n=1 Tax=Candidatus Enterococcus huntleyi TaxID=1857217 RepID=UPI0013794EB5|nr:NAD(P)-dependent oxidoreductase [Enterococcus sp. JM4C]KAF1296092.1 NADH-flavin reductase [Enterococcus sp. JM4C]